ncbi:antirestriction protein ArdA [Shimia sp. R9_3]|uniref:antirestriction protein ArdA n=1 Tax=Shimia sp. R9_3 TaxID=2821113 RepID=UPI001ADB3050|nr:antirestriction protein ArdA [Shimia sp. R9_3]MBO9403330.1 antirestriction protein ArdA [Shimia sp. R9_3]
MPHLHAQPYDISATGFFFETIEDYRAKASALRNAHGDPVEEFEIQFIDGAEYDCALAAAIGLNQANLARYLECCERWEDWEKLLVIIAVGECGYDVDPNASPEQYEIDIYHVESMRALAEQFVEDGLIGDIPENLLIYFDYDALARELSVDYSEFEIGGERLIYCAS